MAKKKSTINLSDKNIIFQDREQQVQVLSLNLNSMDVEVIVMEDEKKKVKKMPFAHLPKEIKKVVRPL